MTVSGHADNRARLDGLRAAQYDWDEAGLRAAIGRRSARRTRYSDVPSLRRSDRRVGLYDARLPC